ncbi:hypothetical protein B0T24DRAFT_23172 [Lasiosphaeria ovina]|uniref:Uncharacterized protein n=1 Tax=Lasiosphaeria ovina TaxID=92902 RepID=A0AAE0NJY4_9PEZI|nr:hypothetical protein B0T24DRAFT_23172 [Lasiosphaeria ovina]
MAERFPEAARPVILTCEPVVLWAQGPRVCFQIGHVCRGVRVRELGQHFRVLRITAVLVVVSYVWANSVKLQQSDASDDERHLVEGQLRGLRKGDMGFDMGAHASLATTPGGHDHGAAHHVPVRCPGRDSSPVVGLDIENPVEEGEESDALTRQDHVDGVFMTSGVPQLDSAYQHGPKRQRIVDEIEIFAIRKRFNEHVERRKNLVS